MNMGIKMKNGQNTSKKKNIFMLCCNATRSIAQV